MYACDFIFEQPRKECFIWFGLVWFGCITRIVWCFGTFQKSFSYCFVLKFINFDLLNHKLKHLK